MYNLGGRNKSSSVYFVHVFIDLIKPQQADISLDQ